MSAARPRVVGVFVVVVGLVLLRQPHALLRPQFVWEEAAAFWATTFTLSPPAYLVEPWAGYLHVLPRAAFLLARVGPPEVAPAVTVVIHSLIIGGVAALLASDRMAPAIPDVRIRTAVGLAIAVLPASEPYVSVLSAQWFLAIAVSVLVLVPVRRSDYPLIALAGLSGVGALLPLPLYWRDRRGIVLLGSAGAQAVAVLMSERRPDFEIDWLASPIVLLIAVSALSMTGPATRAQRHLALVAVATVALGSITYALGTRYLLAAAAALAVAGASGIADRRPLGLSLAVIFAILAFAAFPIPAVPDSRWDEHARCIGGAVPCVVPVVPEQWSVHWPGDPALYLAPRGFDALGMPKGS